MTPQEVFFALLSGQTLDISWAENILKDSAQYAFEYSIKIKKGRFIEAENIISKSPAWAFWYSRMILKGRFIEAEKYIQEDLYYYLLYSVNILLFYCPDKSPNSLLNNVPKNKHKLFESLEDRYQLCKKVINKYRNEYNDPNMKYHFWDGSRAFADIH